MTTIYIEDSKKLPKRSAFDHYPTRPEVARAAIATLLAEYPPPTGRTPWFLDPGAGNGVWGQSVREQLGRRARIVGVELQEKFHKPKGHSGWVNADFLRERTVRASYDYVIGNPPYSLAEQFVRTGLLYLPFFGVMMYLMRLEFLASQGRGKGLFQEHPPTHVYVCSRRPGFNVSDNKTAPQEYALYVWSKYENSPTKISWWDYKITNMTKPPSKSVSQPPTRCYLPNCPHGPAAYYLQLWSSRRVVEMCAVHGLQAIKNEGFANIWPIPGKKGGETDDDR